MTRCWGVWIKLLCSSISVSQGDKKLLLIPLRQTNKSWHRIVNPLFVCNWSNKDIWSIDPEHYILRNKPVWTLKVCKNQAKLFLLPRLDSIYSNSYMKTIAFGFCCIFLWLDCSSMPKSCYQTPQGMFFCVTETIRMSLHDSTLFSKMEIIWQYPHCICHPCKVWATRAWALFSHWWCHKMTFEKCYSHCLSHIMIHCNIGCLLDTAYKQNNSSCNHGCSHLGRKEERDTGK